MTTIDGDSWYPADCLTTVKQVQDGFCDGSFTCTKEWPANSKGCTEIDGVTVCEDDLQTPPHPRYFKVLSKC